jgi:hypothetical protein
MERLRARWPADADFAAAYEVPIGPFGVETGVAVLAVSGTVDGSTAPQLRQRLRDLVDLGHPSLRRASSCQSTTISSESRLSRPLASRRAGVLRALGLAPPR